ncbi:unnamed protein product [Cochlearia groenlandica]
MASSSSQISHHQLPNIHGGATAAPPPTPSCTHPNTTTTKSETAADALSRLFINRLPPNLSLPNRRSSSAATSSSSADSLPTVSLSAENHNDLISAATEFGYFQLANDSETINIIIAETAESDSLSLLDLNEEKKESSFPKNWPFGYDSDTETPSFCLDSNCNSTESTELKLSSLRELTRSLEKIGLETVEMLAKAFGFNNPFNEPNRFSTMMWLNQSVVDGDDKPEITDGFYPFVVCLQYQIREQKCCLLSESGWVSVSPHVDSVLVTLGDIAQVWCNGEIKRVRYRPVVCSGQLNGTRKCVTMTLMLTLPMDTMVSPLKGINEVNKEEEEEYGEEEEEEEGEARSEEKMVFKSFGFEDYAWRVYHERFFFKDPLDRYKIKY